MQSVAVAQGRGGVRTLAIAVIMSVLLLLAMPGLWAAFSAPAVAIAVAGGIAVGISALAARSAGTARRL